MKKRRILVIDDERAIRETLSEILTDEGYAVTAVESGEDGLRRFLEETFDLVFLDVWLRDRDGLSLLEAADGRLSEVPVVMISGHANVETAVRAVRLGAYDFLEKPLSLERVVLTAQKAIERRDLLAEVARFRDRRESESTLLGDSAPMWRLKEEIARVAPTDARALVTGENGTGKELVARQIHRLSGRAGAPLVEVNCAAIPEDLIESELFGHVRGSFTGASEDRRGKFEEADGATLFLDEVADMSAKTQAKVLRALQEGRFTRVGGSKLIASDARVLSATNKNLQEEIRRGGDPARRLPRRPLLPARRRPDPRSPASREDRRHPPARRLLLAGGLGTVRKETQVALSRRRRSAPGIPVAGQRPGAKESDRAADDPVALRRGSRRGPPRRDPRWWSR